MSVFLDTRGKSNLGIALCDRCFRKMSITELYVDPNSPGLRVCQADLDDFDPWRLAARQPEKIDLPFVRPDVNIATNPAGIISQDETEFITTQDGEEYLIP